MVNAKSTQHHQGPATVLAIGTAAPANTLIQAEVPDRLFKAANSDQLTELKMKFTKICEASAIKKRHSIWTEEIVNQNPSIGIPNAPSLGARQNILIHEVPKLGKLAAERAIKEWGQPISKLTHLIFCTTSGLAMPGFDCKLAHLLGLPSTINRYMLYHQGCHGGGTTLRLAKDLAQNNPSARVLVVCVEISLHGFHSPSEEHLDNLVTLAIFGDGASAMIVGADPDLAAERPAFEIISANQKLLPNTSLAIVAELDEAGFMVHLSRNIAKYASENVESCLEEALAPLGITDWNSIFWVVHPGGVAILDGIEAKMKLNKEKLLASRNVLANYGNVQSATAMIVLDKMRKQSAKAQKSTTGEGLEWGVLLAFGPGMTVETIVLRAIPI
ncbi:chalcone synthase [Carex littledalei]|uniref:chalcone synthase n=1 Tax=Carex littledalei TaxID=544730 RepID=A0A833RG05_9POAL|nr:chalcone synthase [Carex littledalei]